MNLRDIADELTSIFRNNGKIVTENEHGHAVRRNLPLRQRLAVFGIELLEAQLPETPSYVCKDCGEYGHGWMVLDSVWKQIAKADDSDPADPYLIVCLSCAEIRLGRNLKITDFTNVRINDPLNFGYQVAEREFGESSEDAQDTKDDHYISIFLWSFMVEQLAFIRAIGTPGLKWRYVEEYLVHMLNQGPFADALAQFGVTANERITELRASELNWRRMLKQTLAIGTPDESA